MQNVISNRFNTLLKHKQHDIYADFVLQKAAASIDTIINDKTYANEKAKAKSLILEIQKNALEKLDRQDQLIAGVKSVELADFDNVGYSLIDYIHNPNNELWLKVLFYIVTLQITHQHDKTPFFVSNKTIAKELNRIGEFVYPKGTTRAKQNNQSLRKMSYKWCTEQGVKSSLKLLKQLNLITTKKSVQTIKRDGKEPRKCIVRYIDVDIALLAEVTSTHMDNAEIDRSYAARSPMKKLAKRPLMIVKALVKKAYQKVQEKYKSIKELYYTYIRNITRKYYRWKKNKLLTKQGYGTLNEREFVKVIRQDDTSFNNSSYKSSYNNRHKVEPSAWVLDWIADIDNKAEKLE